MTGDGAQVVFRLRHLRRQDNHLSPVPCALSPGKLGAVQRTRKSVYRRLIDEMLDLVGGSQPLLAHLVDSGKLSVADLKAIEKKARK